MKVREASQHQEVNQLRQHISYLDRIVDAKNKELE